MQTIFKTLLIGAILALGTANSLADDRGPARSCEPVIQ
jgi:hypothetical protein